MENRDMQLPVISEEISCSTFCYHQITTKATCLDLALHTCTVCKRKVPHLILAMIPSQG